jgi:hypothetical protein
MPVQIQIRNGTAAQWTSANPTLAAGEVGIETDTRKQKFGDGTTAWNSLSYAGGTGTVTGVTAASPVLSSGGAIPSISLASGYGDTLNPYASKTANFVLAAPNGSANVPSFRALVSADIPTLNQNTTGTAAGLSATLAVASGGTGQTTAISAFNALAPSQSGNSGKYLTTDGTNSSWGTVSGGGTPAAPPNSIQFNSSGSFGGSANLTWDGSNVQLGAAGALRFADSDNSNYASFQSPATLAANTAYTLPSALPTASGQVLSATTAGVMSWVDNTAPTAPTSVSYLVVGGGGAGGGNRGGGGGAGGLLAGTVSVSTGTSYTITVGAAGAASGGTAAAGGNGGASKFGSLVNGSTGAVGGGGGGVGNQNSSILYGQDGGSGGGAGGNAATNTVGTGVSGQGNNGGPGLIGSAPFGGGGGGGAGAVGGTASSSGGNGGAGSISTIISTTVATTNSVGQVVGSDVYFAGGGGGGSQGTSSATGGNGGGGAAGVLGGTSGTTNTGGGGAGATESFGSTANGGSGVVIIAYPNTFADAASTSGSPIITTSGSNKVYIFTGNGSITW